MDILIYALVGAALFVILTVVLRRGPSLERAVEEAIEAGGVDKLVEHIEGRGERDRPETYNQAVRMLWDGYHRGLAVALIREMAKVERDAHITQYWIKQALSVEPSLAKEQMDDEFLSVHYVPEVAATCGSVG